MTSARTSRRASREPKEAQLARTAPFICKTCTSCRQRKVKCDGARPKCRYCDDGGLSCEYPKDARRELRPSKARVQSLENTVAYMLEHLRTSGIHIPNVPQVDNDADAQVQEMIDSSLTGEEALFDPEPQIVDVLQSPSLATTSPSETAGRRATTSSGFHRATSICSGISGGHVGSEQDRRGHILDPDSATMTHHATHSPPTSDGRRREAETELQTIPVGDGGGSIDASLTHCEARVAGVFHEHGCVSSVHGLAGIMNPTLRECHKENISKLAWKGEAAIAESRARLISNAALQKQREIQMFRQPLNPVDLDGCSGELTKHLLDLHFNRQHYASVMVYRPAVMDSLATGGPWINKLLLNAIFYSSSPYSDWDCLRSDTDDLQGVGDHFYRRFKQLLADEIDKPSIPSAIALLLVSGTLVSQGQSSAGWTLSGMAYRMMMDLGCHMILGPDFQSAASQSSRRKLHRDLEQEMRKRLYWGAYVTDATQALYLGRPCMFASVEARVPLQLLDSFEELEPWEPYVDQYSVPLATPPFESQPARAVSTFMALARLLQISSRITDLYGIQSIKLSNETLLDRGRSIEWELDNWRTTLPAHLRLDPEGTSTPPPHQITPQCVPFTDFCVLSC